MTDTKETLAEISALLKAGKTQEADDLAASHLAEVEAAPAPAPVATPAPAAPPPAPAWMTDAAFAFGLLQQVVPLFESIVQSLGNQAAHVQHVNNLKATMASAAPAADTSAK
jgi:hypothetical protein